MIFSIHAGHNPDGKTACGATGIIKESTEARAITQAVVEKLRAAGHTAYDDTVNDGTSQNDVLRKIANKCNSHNVDLVVSIHANSGRNDYVGDGNIGGTEVYVIDNKTSKALPYAQNIVSEMSNLGFRNRGVKSSTSLYVLKHTKAPALLFETLFVDDRDDCNLYQTIGVNGVADAVVKALIGQVPVSVSVPTPSVFASFEAAVTGNANIRNKPSMDGRVIGSAGKGQEVMVWGQEGEWCLVDSGKWIHNSLIAKKDASASQSAPQTSTPVGVITNIPTPAPAPAPVDTSYVGKIKGTGVRVRKGPGTNYAVVCGTKNGQTVRVYEEQNGWGKVDADKWVALKYIERT